MVIVKTSPHQLTRRGQRTSGVRQPATHPALSTVESSSQPAGPAGTVAQSCFTFALQAAHSALTEVAENPGMRWLLLTLCVALVFASPGGAASETVDRGLIIKMRPPRFVLRELDGSRMRFAIKLSTIVTLDGRRVRLAQLRRGDVALVVHNGRVVVAVSAFRP
jgi:hypothetical protein